MTLVPGSSEAKLANPKSWLLRPYGAPFLILYPAFAHIYFNYYEKYICGPEWTYVFLGSIVSLQILLLLMPYWNIRIREWFELVATDTVENAKLIEVIPKPNQGAPDVCAIQRDEDGVVSFVFQKRRYIYNESLNQFVPPQFLADKPDVKIGEFQFAKGIDPYKIPDIEKQYGLNQFDIPVPSFIELWKEHAVAPFFVFQIFCVSLWFMDEMWKYSLFTLFMLVTFESTVVFQRQRTMVEFRRMGVKPYQIHVYRGGEWVEIVSSQLLPGDIVSLNRTPQESGIPCDLLLLHGSAIVNEAMLSGESTPLLKESTVNRIATERFDPEGLDKNSLLFGGTKILQVTPPPPAEELHVAPPPEGDVIAIALRTGFETSQGSLVRVMIFSTEHVGAGNKEAYLFILFLLVFAIAASWYVWTEGVKMDRKRTKLLLDCILIITSVVPPELPMELTMAVNSSLNALSKFYIYCTEPFRVPFAGRIDVCCFDKTGTLTAEDLVVQGMAGLNQDILSLTDIKNIPSQITRVLAAAHALILLDDDEIVGDPMEQTTLRGIGWDVQPNGRVQSRKNVSEHLHIIKRFQFSSVLKRSSSIARLADGRLMVAVKGAPETISKMLVDEPDWYEETFKHYTRKGSRVLAFAYKYIDKNLPEKRLVEYTREAGESKLQFAGFLVFHCPLKDDACETIKMLNESSHRTVMITGDNPLTAVKVAQDVGIVERKTLILDTTEDDPQSLVWQSVDGEVNIPCPITEPLTYDLYEKWDLCVSGHALSLLQDHGDVAKLIRHTWVYARVSPSQKEFILITLKSEGYMTLMCGDGTNDVGALKQAHVGIALLNATEEGMKNLAEKQRMDAIVQVYEKQCEMMKKWGSKPPIVPKAIAHLYQPGPQNPHYVAAIEARGGHIEEETRKEILELAKSDGADAKIQAATLADRMTSMLEEEQTEAPTLKLGDASVAAPMTSKLANVSAVTHIIRQGRCTLVTTIQMYKILALNCLISAYSLSVLYLAGIKMSDGQSTISGILLSICFMSISRARVVEKLSKERPQPGIFNKYIMGSILGQFAVHIVTLIYITSEVYKLEPKVEKIDLEAKFEPSLLNTTVYLLQLVQQISTFAVNYQGRPFREGITENRGMYYGILGVAGLAFAGATELVPEMNEKLQLVKMTPLFKFMLTTVMILDFGVAFLIERVLKYLYADCKPSDIALRLNERDTIVQHKRKRH